MAVELCLQALHTTVWRQPEAAWLARAQTSPAGRQLLQASSARAFLQQQQRVHASIQRRAFTELRVPQHHRTVKAAWICALPSSLRALRVFLAVQWGCRCPQTARPWYTTV